MQQIIFSFETQYGNFCDALWLEDDHGLTDDQIEVMKQERLSNWLAVVTPRAQSDISEAPVVPEVLNEPEVPVVTEAQGGV